MGKDNDFFTIYFQVEDESKFKDFQVGMVILISNEKFHSMFHEVKNDSHCTGVITSSDPSKCQVKVTISQEHGDEYLISNFSKVSSDAANFRVWAVLSKSLLRDFTATWPFMLSKKYTRYYFLLLSLNSLQLTQSWFKSV